MEVSIIDKIKSLDEDHYDKAKEKSIVALYKYLQSKRANQGNFLINTRSSNNDEVIDLIIN